MFCRAGEEWHQAYHSAAKLYGKRKDAEGVNSKHAFVGVCGSVDSRYYKPSWRKETLDNLARSKLAKNCLHVVLGMEAGGLLFSVCLRLSVLLS